MGPLREMPKPFNTMVEVAACTGKNLYLRLPALVDTGQNVREGIILSSEFCKELGLMSKLMPNSSVPLSYNVPSSKIKVLERLREGVCKIRLAPNFRFNHQWLRISVTQSTLDWLFLKVQMSSLIRVRWSCVSQIFR